MCCAARRLRTSRGGYRPLPRRDTESRKTKRWVSPGIPFIRDAKQLLWVDVKQKVKRLLDEGRGGKYFDLKVYLCVFPGRHGDQ